MASLREHLTPVPPAAVTGEVGHGSGTTESQGFRFSACLVSNSYNRRIKLFQTLRVEITLTLDGETP